MPYIIISVCYINPGPPSTHNQLTGICREKLMYLLILLAFYIFICLFLVLWIQLKKIDKAFAVMTSIEKRKNMWVEVVSAETKVY